MADRLQNLLLSALSVLVMILLFGLGELAVRLVTVPAPDWGEIMRDEILQPSPDFGWELKPNYVSTAPRKAIGIWVPPMRTNSLGLRDEEFSVEKEQGAFRILALGDSVTFGWGVEAEETYVEQIEDMLNARFSSRQFEVINAGVPGRDTPNELEYLQQVGLSYDPDLVTVGWVVNDVQGARAVTLLNAPIPFKRLLEKSALYVFLRNTIRRGLAYGITNIRYDQKAADKEQVTMLESDTPATQAAWVENLGYLEEMARITRQKGIPLVLVIFPNSFQLEPEYSDARIQAILKEFAETNSVSVVDLLPAFKRESQSGTVPLFLPDSHPNPKGHRVAAEEIYTTLITMGLVPMSGSQ